MKDKSNEIKFPCRWEYRVIADAAEAEKSRAAISLAGAAENIAFEILPGGVSGGGKYCALRVACEVPSLDRSREIAKLLTQAEGVKFVL